MSNTSYKVDLYLNDDTLSLDNSGVLEPSTGILSKAAAHLFQWICFLTCEVIVIFGTVTNIINIVCFVKQQFKDSINISLFGLAISDLGSLITLFYSSLSVIPAYQEADLPFITLDVQNLVSGMPHMAFSRVTTFITAFITLERCLCITMPLKVREILTPKRTTSVIVGIFVTLICSISPVYYSNRLGMKFSYERNKTLLGLVYTPDRLEVEQYSYAINNVFIPFSAFIIIIVSMAILVVKLRKQSAWRMKCANIVTTDTVSDRELRVSKMIVMISTLFVVCFSPSAVTFLAMVIVPELSISGRYSNMLVVTLGIGAILEAINSSMNIFIYYKMSSKYRDTFNRMFQIQKPTVGNLGQQFSQSSCKTTKKN